MLVLFGIVAAAVITVACSRWDKVSLGTARTCGLLSIALGVRAVALITALLAFPLFSSTAWSDEPAPTVTESEPETSDAPAPESLQTASDETATNASVASEPVASEPVASEPVASEPVPSEPVTSEPVPSEQPAGTEGATASDETKAETVEPTLEAAVEPPATAPAETLKPLEPAATEEKRNVEAPTPSSPTESSATKNASEPVSEKADPVPSLAENPSDPLAPAEAEIADQKNSAPVLPLSPPSLDASTAKPESPKHLEGLVAEQESTSETPITDGDKLASSAMIREPVKFITNINYLTPNRPNWLETPPTYDEAAGVVQVTVKAGPYRSVRDCEPDLEKEVSMAVADFVNQHLKARHASTFVTYSLDELRRRKVVREQFGEQLGTSLGLMNQVHAQLVFDNKFQDEIEHRWSEITAKSRLAQTGLGAGVVLLLLSTLFSYFKVDTATKGYYTGRLQFATAGAILALVAASVLLAKWIPWM